VGCRLESDEDIARRIQNIFTAKKTRLKRARGAETRPASKLIARLPLYSTTLLEPSSPPTVSPSSALPLIFRARCACFRGLFFWRKGGLNGRPRMDEWMIRGWLAVSQPERRKRALDHTPYSCSLFLKPWSGNDDGRIGGMKRVKADL
jgi:hypothetical protein